MATAADIASLQTSLDAIGPWVTKGTAELADIDALTDYQNALTSAQTAIAKADAIAQSAQTHVYLTTVNSLSTANQSRAQAQATAIQAWNMANDANLQALATYNSAQLTPSAAPSSGSSVTVAALGFMLALGIFLVLSKERSFA